jgi:hypothetical protein
MFEVLFLRSDRKEYRFLRARVTLRPRPTRASPFKLFCIGLWAAGLTCLFVFLAGAFSSPVFKDHDDVVRRAALYGIVALVSFGGALWMVLSLRVDSRRKLSHPHSDSN